MHRNQDFTEYIMAKNLEKLIEETVVPEMEYAQKSARISPVTVDDIPEVVLPKTKAEVYREAKGRLNQKTKAVSKRTATEKPQKKPRVKVKTVELEIAAVTETAEQVESEQIKYRKHTLKNPDVEPVWVGGADEIVPFAWRHPLMPDIKRPTKLYRQTVKCDAPRSWFLPALRDKN